MPRRRLALVLCAAALVAAGCGDDEEASETFPTEPELTVPGGDTGDETATTATQAPAPAETATTPQAPAPAPDSPENDTPPPPGSPAERFEEFCEQNPGAC